MTDGRLLVAVSASLFMAMATTSCALVVGFTDVGVADVGVPDAGRDAERDVATHDARVKSDSGKDAGRDVAMVHVADADAAKSHDAGPHDTGGSDVVGQDAPAGCGALTQGATDVFVNGSFSGTTPIGTAACPFVTIAAAITWAGSPTMTTTIHVKAGTYYESATVNAYVFLHGDDGAAVTTISGSGTCQASQTCAVLILAGGTLDGFTVVSDLGDGIETGAGTPSPVVLNVSANGSIGNGIYALGGVEIGPNVTANSNHETGLESPPGATGLVHVIANAGGTNAFDNNTHQGIDVSSSGQLVFEGGTASQNGGDGMRLSSTGNVTHTLTGLVANDNAIDGVVAYGQTIVMRSSTMLGNQVGLLAQIDGSGSLDIGLTTSGSNVFGTTRDAGATLNTLAGIEICGTTAGAALNAGGDSWSQCAPKTATTAAADAGTVKCPTFVGVSGYVDAIFTAAAVGSFTATGCITTGT